jgi:hypothetical protein
VVDEFMSKKAVAVVGGIAGVAGIAYLISRVAAKPTVQVALTSKPIRTVILVDGKDLVATPKTITLTKGKHTFAAVPKSPDLVLTYAFHSWTLNGQVASHSPTAQINITKPAVVTANFLVSQSGVYPVIPA